LGVKPLFELPKIKNPDKLIEKFKNLAIEKNIFTKGDKVIITMGSLVGKEGTTNMIRVIEF